MTALSCLRDPCVSSSPSAPAPPPAAPASASVLMATEQLEFNGQSLFTKPYSPMSNNKRTRSTASTSTENSTKAAATDGQKKKKKKQFFHHKFSRTLLKARLYTYWAPFPRFQGILHYQGSQRKSTNEQEDKMLSANDKPLTATSKRTALIGMSENGARSWTR